MWATDTALRHTVLGLVCIAAALQPAQALDPQPSTAPSGMAQRAGGPAAGSAARPDSPAAPRIDALPQPATRSAIDLEAIARGYAALTDAQAAEGLTTSPGLLVFISLSMPQSALQRLIEQAERARAALVLRGLANGSLRDTVVQVQALIGPRKIAVQIDPEAFDRYAVTQVPSFVLVRADTRPVACAAGRCAPPDSFVRTAGDVSLDYALAHMLRAAPGFRSEAASYLQRLGR